MNDMTIIPCRVYFGIYQIFIDVPDHLNHSVIDFTTRNKERHG